jgi:hypothetical protein
VRILVVVVVVVVVVVDHLLLSSPNICVECSSDRAYRVEPPIPNSKYTARVRARGSKRLWKACDGCDESKHKETNTLASGRQMLNKRGRRHSNLQFLQ